MKLTEHDLKQINNETLDRLSSEEVLSFTKTLLSDHKEAMDRLNQNSNNSSRPPSSEPPWVSIPLNQKDLDNESSDHDDYTDDDDDTGSSLASNASDSPPLELNVSDIKETTMAPLQPIKEPPFKTHRGEARRSRRFWTNAKFFCNRYCVPFCNPLCSLPNFAW